MNPSKPASIMDGIGKKDIAEMGIDLPVAGKKTR
jgi:hypothetical protein